MGWGRMMLLGNLEQQLDIGDLGNAVTEMQSAFLENQRADLDQAKAIAAPREPGFEALCRDANSFACIQRHYQTGRNRNRGARG